MLQGDPDMKSDQCKSHTFHQCDDQHENECVGMEKSEYVYQVVEEIGGLLFLTIFKGSKGCTLLRTVTR